MGKTVKSRVVLSITSIICVIVICIIANKGIPSLYESHRQKAVAQEAASRAAEQVEIPKTTAPSATQTPATEPSTEATEQATVTEDANVYDIPEETTQEETTTQAEEEYTEEETTEPNSDSSDSEGSFFEKIINFFTKLFEAITSGDFFNKISEFFSGIFGKLGF